MVARLGSGGRFRTCVRKVSKRKGVYNPAGLCAYIGRKKYGKRKFAQLSHKKRK